MSEVGKKKNQEKKTEINCNEMLFIFLATAWLKN